jgi:hypothetical protein
VESFDSDEPAIVIAVLAQKRQDALPLQILTAPEGEVGTPGAKIGLNSGAERGVADPLVQLE